MAKMTRRMAEAKIQETLNEYNKKIEEAKNYIDYLPLEGKKLVENYEKNLDNRKTLLNKAAEDKSFFETLTDEQLFNLLRICQALIKKFELVIKEDNNMIEKKNNLDKAMLLLEEFGDEKSQKAIREYKNGKRSILFGKLSKNTYGMTKNLNSIYTHIITNDFEKDTIENQIRVAITLAHEFKRNGVTNSINVETRDIVLEDTKIIESFASIYGEEIYKKFPEYGILHYIKKIFGETELKDFADFAFDSTGNYWKVNEAGDLIDDGNTSKVFDTTGKEVYSGSTGRQGTLEAWLNLDNAFVSLLKPAGYEYNGKQWSKNPGRIDCGIIEKAHKGGLLTDDQYKLIQLAAGKSASNDDKSEKIGLFKQILTDYYKVKAMQTQVQIDLADRAWEWLGRKVKYAKEKISSKMQLKKGGTDFSKALKANEKIKEDKKWGNNEHHCDEYCEAVLKAAGKLPSDWPGTDYKVSYNDNGKNKKSFMVYYRSKLKNSPEPGWNIILMDGHNRSGLFLAPHMVIMYLRDDGLIDFSHYTSDTVVEPRIGWTLKEMTDTGKGQYERFGYSNFKYLPLGK